MLNLLYFTLILFEVCEQCKIRLCITATTTTTTTTTTVLLLSLFVRALIVSMLDVN
jgi:hypothetical protein